jgi:hypothetical protein
MKQVACRGSGLHGVVSEKIEPFITIAVRTSDPTQQKEKYRAKA